MVSRLWKTKSEVQKYRLTIVSIVLASRRLVADDNHIIFRTVGSHATHPRKNQAPRRET